MLSVAILCAVPVLAVSADGIQDDAVRLSGTWTCVSVGEDGWWLPEFLASYCKISFRGKEFEFGDDLGTEGGSFDLKSAESPKGIDLIYRKDGKTFRGIYEMKEDRLRICYDPDHPSERPSKFTSGFTSSCVLLAFKKARD